MASELVVGRYLSRLGDGDSEGRRAAMHSLKAFVEQLDSGSMPAFLQQMSPSRGTGLGSPQSRSHAISLYEEVVKAHGKLVIPHIGRMMATVTRSLAMGSNSSCGSSPQLHQACARVVAAVARHAIDPAGPSSEGEAVLRSLCNPLLEAVVADSEAVAAGAALCLQALVESEKWRYAKLGMVQELGERVCASVREKGGRGVAHLQLARSLVAACAPVMGDFGVQLLRAASQVLLVSGGDGAWQTRVCAARLMQAVLWGMDRRMLAGEEVAAAVKALQLCRHDKSPKVRDAALEALQSASVLMADGSGQRSRMCYQKGSGELKNAAVIQSGGGGVGSGDEVPTDEERRPSDGSHIWNAADSPMRLIGHSTEQMCCGGEEESARTGSSDGTSLHSPQRQEQPSKLLTADDAFLPFTTPRRLLHSLVVDADHGSNEMPKVGESAQLDMDTCSDGNWSVHDNPIVSAEAFDREQDVRTSDRELEQTGTTDRYTTTDPVSVADDKTFFSASSRNQSKSSEGMVASHETPLFALPTGINLETVYEEPLKSADADASKLEKPGLPAYPDQRISAVTTKSLRLIRGLVEMVLGGSLCAMVALPVAIALSKIFESQSYCADMLVPT